MLVDFTCQPGLRKEETHTAHKAWFLCVPVMVFLEETGICIDARNQEDSLSCRVAAQVDYESWEMWFIPFFSGVNHLLLHWENDPGFSFKKDNHIAQWTCETRQRHWERLVMGKAIKRDVSSWWGRETPPRGYVCMEKQGKGRGRHFSWNLQRNLPVTLVQWIL